MHTCRENKKRSDRIVLLRVLDERKKIWISILDWSACYDAMQGFLTGLETMKKGKLKSLSKMNTASGVTRLLKFVDGDVYSAHAHLLHPFKYIAKLG